MNPLPTINCILNALSFIFLVLGYVEVRKRHFENHKRLMLAAFLVSAAFLASYLYYHFNYEANRFGGEGFIRQVYFFILISHIILAVANLPFILRIMYLALTHQLNRHAKLARFVFPVWAYTSLTGVLVYFFLYIWFPIPPSGP